MTTAPQHEDNTSQEKVSCFQYVLQSFRPVDALGIDVALIPDLISSYDEYTVEMPEAVATRLLYVVLADFAEKPTDDVSCGGLVPELLKRGAVLSVLRHNGELLPTAYALITEAAAKKNSKIDASAVFQYIYTYAPTESRSKILRQLRTAAIEADSREIYDSVQNHAKTIRALTAKGFDGNAIQQLSDNGALQVDEVQSLLRKSPKLLEPLDKTTLSAMINCLLPEETDDTN